MKYTTRASENNTDANPSGMYAWRRFFEDYQSIVDRLVDCGAIPQSSEIINVAERFASVRKDQADDQKPE